MSRWVDGWKLRDDWRAPRAALQRDAENFTRPSDRDPLVPVAGPIASMRVLNPENLPRESPDKIVKCRCLTPFAYGDGRDIKPGELVELPAWRARHLAGLKTVEIAPDAAALRTAAALREAERRLRLEAAAKIARGPHTRPLPRVEQPPVPEGEQVTVRCLRCFALGSGVDTHVGQLVTMSIEDGLRRIASGLAEVAEGEPGAAQPAEQPAPVTKAARSDTR